MLFNSFGFIFLFLPLTLAGFYWSARKFGNEIAMLWLVLASLFFYAWWNPVYIVLLLASMVFNFYVGRRLGQQPKKWLLTTGIAANLGLLGYYKYANFFVDNVNLLADANWQVGDILLPLAISFFTFQQIAYLVDSYQGITKEYSPVHYALFVSFFPQLIAGPIVHHKEMLPQFESKRSFAFNQQDFAIGLSIFAIGLFKKTVLADSAALYANPVFLTADSGQQLDFFTAWMGALAYTFQLYFDFSGYSDMAIGLARMFGIKLPLNFYSPYKATNISEFWRRWHMTLSRFLRDYVYIPLGGNRNGNIRRYSNLMTTMLLGGLWHGAGWNFVIWGALHGAYLSICQMWQTLIKSILGYQPNNAFYRVFAWLTTFIAVIIGWVFFRATTLDGAIVMLQSMIGMNEIGLPNAIMSRLGGLQDVFANFGIQSLQTSGSQFVNAWLLIMALAIIALVMPNTQDMFSKVEGSLNKQSFERESTFWPFFSRVNHLVWQDNSKWALLCGAALAFGALTLLQVSEFLYFQF